MRYAMTAVLLVAVLACTVGCGPSWHSGNERFALRHKIDGAELHGDSLIVTGSITPLVAVTDYGVKVFKARDDTGRELPFKSFQMTYAKGMWFTIELGAPSPKAKSISLGVAFISRSGPQRILEIIPITRGAPRHWRSHLHSWEPRRPRPSGGGKSVIGK